MVERRLEDQFGLLDSYVEIDYSAFPKRCMQPEVIETSSKGRDGH